MSKPTSVLFVCMGNICRSPTAEGVFRKQLAERAPELEIDIDSAGTHSYHIGEPPDERSQAAARERGIDISDLRARMVTPQDFAHFNHVLAMDAANLEYLKGMCPPQYQSRLRLFLEYAPHVGELSVPDPYSGGADGFRRVLDLVEAASAGLIAHLRRHHAAAAVIGARRRREGGT